jgi:galactonate dehydratase
MAEAYYVPVSPHDASGPINVLAGAHVMMTVPNFYRLETASFDLSGYNQFLKEPLDNSGGSLHMPKTPGLGIEMNTEYMKKNRVE